MHPKTGAQFSTLFEPNALWTLASYITICNEGSKPVSKRVEKQLHSKNDGKYEIQLKRKDQSQRRAYARDSSPKS